MKSYAYAVILFLVSIPAFAQSSGVRFTVGGVSQGVNVSGNAVVTEMTNGTSAVSAGQLVKLSGSPSTTVVPLATDTDGVIGIVETATAAGGIVPIAIDGQATCVFENATTAGDFVTIGSSVAGDCRDAGSSTVRPTGQTIGRVLASGSAGSYLVALGGASGPTGAIGYESKISTCSGNNTTACYATCTAGKHVTGGGCGVSTVSGGSFFLQNSNPGNTTNSWYCYYGGTYTSITISSWALCEN